MYKLVILVGADADAEILEAGFPGFLHTSEQMPGLMRETTSRVDMHLFGGTEYQLLHELIFESPEAARQAMGSEAGKTAGRLLQEMTGGSLVLFLADHKEDDLDHIRQYKKQPPAADAAV